MLQKSDSKLFQLNVFFNGKMLSIIMKSMLSMSNVYTSLIRTLRVFILTPELIFFKRRCSNGFFISRYTTHLSGSWWYKIGSRNDGRIPTKNGHYKFLTIKRDKYCECIRYASLRVISLRNYFPILAELQIRLVKSARLTGTNDIAAFLNASNEPFGSQYINLDKSIYIYDRKFRIDKLVRIQIHSCKPIKFNQKPHMELSISS